MFVVSGVDSCSQSLATCKFVELAKSERENQRNKLITYTKSSHSLSVFELPCDPVSLKIACC
jgi:hypothetical protein